MCPAFRLTAEYWSAGVAALKVAIRQTVTPAPVPAFKPKPWALSDQWTDFGALSQGLIRQPGMKAAMVALVKAKDTTTTDILKKYAAAEGDSEARRLARLVLGDAAVSWTTELS